MRTFIKWIRRVLITLLSIVIMIYTLSSLLPSPALNNTHCIQLYDQDNSRYYQSHINYNDISLKDVSPYFIDSIIAIEDRHFYEHHGFDYLGIARALYRNITRHKTEGASTITQQYARLLYLTNEKTLNRKIQEAFLSTRLEAHYSKDDILTGYINSIYFGHGIYGIKEASLYFFNKDPIDLNLNEASCLAGVINGPTYYSPFNDLENSRKRQSIVLDALISCHKIDDATKKEVLNQKLVLNTNHQSLISQYQYYKDTVIDELKELGFYNEKYINQGLNVYTTLNAPIQNKLIETVNKAMKNEKELEIASVIVDTKTAGTLALIGGKDYHTSSYNRATQASRQVASTMKPLLYYCAIENGFTPITKFLSQKTTFQLENGKTYAPTNFNNQYADQEVTLAQAVAVSDNIYAVKTHLFLGENTLVNTLKRLGYEHVSPHPSLALGTLNTNMYEFANVYTTLAHQGIYNKVHTIDHITNTKGELLYEYKSDYKQVLNKDATLILAQMLKSPFNSKLSTYASATMSAYPTKYSFAAKSGTSPYDALCIGYNPDYTLLNWVGYDDNRELTTATKKRIPKIVFQSMANAIEKKETWYSLTDHLTSVKINPLTGDYDENGDEYWFKN